MGVKQHFLSKSTEVFLLANSESLSYQNLQIFFYLAFFIPECHLDLPTVREVREMRFVLTH